MHRFLVTIIAIIFCTSASAQSEQVWDADDDEALFIRYSSTICYGTCPVVDIYAFEDGGVVFRGSRPIRDLPQERPRSKDASLTMKYFQNNFVYDHIKRDPNSFYALLNELEDAGIFELDERYASSDTCGEWVTDLPSEILEVHTTNRWKKVVYYHGCLVFEDEAVVKNIMEIVATKLSLQYFIDEHIPPQK